MKESPQPFVSRGGQKLQAALAALGVSPAGLLCADFGANVGGFTDCLLRCGARKVYAVDTGYGALAWRLRRDRRVVVMERTNALYAEPPEQVDLVVIDVAFTPQRLIVPAAWRWLGAGGQVVSLLKPHYELAKLPGARPAGRRQRLALTQAAELCRVVCEELGRMGLGVSTVAVSPLKGKGGNTEFFIHLRKPGPEGVLAGLDLADGPS